MRHVLLVTLFLAASAAYGQCVDGGIGNATPEAFAPLTSADVDAIVKAADAAAGGGASIAVVDRAGRVLAVFHQNNASANNDDLAVGVARTAAFFSHNMAPLSSRTVRFISGVHFPAGVTNAPPAALYGIEQSNRGCDFGVVWNPGQCVPRSRSLDGIVLDKPCNAGDASGCGAGIVTGKIQPDDGPYPQSLGNRAVNAGGIPLYRVISARLGEGIVDEAGLVGGIGVVGIAGDSQLAEFAAVTGAFGAAGIVPVPKFPLPDPRNVFIA